MSMFVLAVGSLSEFGGVPAARRSLRFCPGRMHTCVCIHTCDNCNSSSAVATNSRMRTAEKHALDAFLLVVLDGSCYLENFRAKFNAQE